MASALTTAGKNLLLEAIDESATGGATHLSLHTSSAPTDFSTEVSGGSPAYVRTLPDPDVARSTLGTLLVRLDLSRTAP